MEAISSKGVKVRAPRDELGLIGNILKTNWTNWEALSCQARQLYGPAMWLQCLHGREVRFVMTHLVDIVLEAVVTNSTNN